MIEHQVWTNGKGDTWSLNLDKQKKVVISIENEQLFVDPPEWPWPYDYVSKLLFTQGFRPPEGVDNGK